MAHASLPENESVQALLQQAVASNDPEAVRDALDQGADPNLPITGIIVDDEDGDSVETIPPIFLATANAHVEVAIILIEAGCDLTTEVEANGLEGSPLAWATNCNQGEIAAKMIKYGANYGGYVDNIFALGSIESISAMAEMEGSFVGGMTDVPYFFTHCHAPIERQMAALQTWVHDGLDLHGKDPETGNGLLATCIRLGSANGHMEPELLSAFLQTDLRHDINAPNHEGMTPLMLACRRLDYDSIRTLLERGADNSVKDNEGRTALYHLMNPGYVRVRLRHDTPEWAAHLQQLKETIRLVLPAAGPEASEWALCDVVTANDATIGALLKSEMEAQLKRLRLTAAGYGVTGDRLTASSDGTTSVRATGMSGGAGFDLGSAAAATSTPLTAAGETDKESSTKGDHDPAACKARLDTYQGLPLPCMKAVVDMAYGKPKTGASSPDASASASGGPL